MISALGLSIKSAEGPGFESQLSPIFVLISTKCIYKSSKSTSTFEKGGAKVKYLIKEHFGSTFFKDGMARVAQLVSARSLCL